MSRLYSDLIKRLSAYTPGEQPKDKKYIKLNTNENPYPPSAKVLNAIKENVNGNLALYPDPDSSELTEQLASFHNVDKQCIFVSNGSDETLAFAFMAFYANKKIAYPKVTYSFYPVYAKLCNAKPTEIPMSPDFSIDREALSGQRCGIVIANPNAPTSEFIDFEYIVKLIENNKDHVILVDEAYMDFSGTEGMAEYTKKYDNLLVVKTFSKAYSLAGMRIGYAIGNEQLISALNMVKDSFNSYPLDKLAQTAAVSALKDQKYFDEMNEKVVATRDRISKELECSGCTVYKSSANFLFVSFFGLDSLDVYTKFRNKGILVRRFASIPDYVRISVGTDEQMDILLNVAKEFKYEKNANNEKNE